MRAEARRIKVKKLPSTNSVRELNDIRTLASHKLVPKRQQTKYSKQSCPSLLGSPVIMPWPQPGMVYPYSPVFRVKHRIWALGRGCFQLEPPPAGHPGRHSACSTVEALQPPETLDTKGQQLDRLLTARSFQQPCDIPKNDHST